MPRCRRQCDERGCRVAEVEGEGPAVRGRGEAPGEVHGAHHAGDAPLGVHLHLTEHEAARHVGVAAGPLAQGVVNPRPREVGAPAVDAHGPAGGRGAGVGGSPLGQHLVMDVAVTEHLDLHGRHLVAHRSLDGVAAVHVQPAPDERGRQVDGPSDVSSALHPVGERHPHGPAALRVRVHVGPRHHGRAVLAVEVEVPRGAVLGKPHLVGEGHVKVVTGPEPLAGRRGVPGHGEVETGGVVDSVHVAVAQVLFGEALHGHVDRLRGRCLARRRHSPGTEEDDGCRQRPKDHVCDHRSSHIAYPPFPPVLNTHR